MREEAGWAIKSLVCVGRWLLNQESHLWKEAGWAVKCLVCEGREGAQLKLICERGRRVGNQACCV